MQQLVEETIVSCKEYLPKLINACDQVAVSLQSGNEGAGIHLIPQIFDGLKWVIEVNQRIQDLEYSLPVDSNKMYEHFVQLEEGLRVRDFIVVADLFQYEIKPVLEEWLEKVNKFTL